MKTKRNIIITSICICSLLAASVLAITFFNLNKKHKHVLGEAKIYHIFNDEIYYTRECKDGCDIKFPTDVGVQDVFQSVAPIDKIVLEEDITLNQSIVLNGFYSDSLISQHLDLEVNFDLNGYSLSTNVSQSTSKSVFMLNGNIGSIKFNVANGSIVSNDLSYIFRFQNTDYNKDNIELNIDNLNCQVSGIKATPIFAHNESSGIKINANNSTFISECSNTSSGGNYGVGVFINSDSEFNFNNCEFQGGDAVYVRRGNIKLDGCRLINIGLADAEVQHNDTFSTVGSCLTADNHRTVDGVGKFNITIDNCFMKRGNSSKAICVIKTIKRDSNLETQVNADSSITVNSCAFNTNPLLESVPQYGLVNYPNGSPVYDTDLQLWLSGDVELLEE